jgi:uncharacterized peroxidase-related enzyme
MARILTVNEEAADERTRAAIAGTKATYGGVFTGIRRVALADAKVGQPVRELYEHLNLRADSPLTRLQREMLGVVVNTRVGGASCQGLHLSAVRKLLHDDEIGVDFCVTWQERDLDQKTKVLLAYAEKLTLSPGAITDDDIDGLRAAGWDEKGIYEATALVGFWNFSGRLEAAAGLPMELIPPEADYPEARA